MAVKSFYEDNVLNQFDSYTYKWTIAMVHPQNAHRFEDVLKEESGMTVILAESGVESEIAIQSVNQSLTLAFKKNQDRLGVGNSFSINLVEPGGATFFTRILEAARRLGIENHMQACYLLELNFIGIHEEGHASDSEVGPYYYMCTTTAVQMDYSDGATRYRMDLVEIKTEAFKPQQLYLKEDTGNIQAGTFGEFLEKFNEIIEVQEQERYLNSITQQYPDHYKFTISPDQQAWKDWAFDEAGADGDTGLVGTSVTGSGQLTFNFAQGTALSDCMVVALLHTTNMRRLPTGNARFHKDSPSDGEAKAETFKELSSWYVFDTDVVYGYYDTQRKSYQKKIEYSIKEHIIGNLVHDPNSYNKAFNSPADQQSRIKKIFRRGLLRKRFDYSYTGLNTEILNLDISLQNTFFMLQPLKQGKLSKRSQNFSNAGDAQTTFNILQHELDELTTSQQNLQLEADKLKSESENTNMDAGQIADSMSIMQDNIAALAAQRADLKDKVQAAYKNLPIMEKRLDTNDRRYITQSEIRASSELNTDMIVSFQQNVVNSKATRGPDNENAGAVMLGAVELNLNTLSDLSQQQLSIRGDPYWLGMPRGTTTQRHGANYTVGGNHYFLNLNFPTYPDPITGLIDISAQNFGILGLYCVTGVNADYSDGQFTMTLQSFRDLNTNIGMTLENLRSGEIETDDAQVTADNFRQQHNDDEQHDHNHGDGSSDGEFIPLDDGTGTETANSDGAGTVTESQGTVANTRKLAIDPGLKSILQNAGTASGVNVDVRSGGQDNTTGSVGTSRHNNGMAADVQLTNASGRVLSLDNPGDVPVIQKFLSEAKKSGALGIGAGNGYMGDNTFHVDIAKPGYWGGVAENGKFYAKNAPAWLKEINKIG